jgi:hypothetical protein
MGSNPAMKTLPEFLSLLTLRRVTRNSVFRLVMPEFEREGRATLPLKVTHVPDGALPGCKLVIQFHGAIDQTKRVIPAFQDVLPASLESADVLAVSIADESLERAKEVRAGWYQGSSRFDLCAAIASLVRHLRELARASRTIFVGSSIGAHAALVQSSHIAESICIANNPIACISRYSRRHRNDYLANCWPGAERFEDIPFPLIDDCGVLYREPYANQLIIIQNPTDHHFHEQAIPFVQQISWHGNALMFSEFDPERIGHAFSPPDLRRWAVAALTATSDRCLDIARRHHALKMLETGPTPTAGNPAVKREATASKGSGSSVDRFEQDSAIASRLAAAARQ